jgi:hypothetical protein
MLQHSNMLKRAQLCLQAQHTQLYYNSSLSPRSLSESQQLSYPLLSPSLPIQKALTDIKRLQYKPKPCNRAHPHTIPADHTAFSQAQSHPLSADTLDWRGQCSNFQHTARLRSKRKALVTHNLTISANPRRHFTPHTDNSSQGLPIVPTRTLPSHILLATFSAIHAASSSRRPQSRLDAAVLICLNLAE